MVKQEIYKNLSKIPNLQDLVENKCYNQVDICNLLKLEGTDREKRNIYLYFKEHNYNLEYNKYTDRCTRIIYRYSEFIPEWWNCELLCKAVLYRLKNSLIINYAGKDKQNVRYVVSFAGHPRASSSNQVKAHILLWEYHNKKLFPNDYVLVPKDGNFCNLDIDNFRCISNEDYRSEVATGKRNHFYTLGNSEGICYKGGWKSISRRLIQTVGKCEICGNTNGLVCHHIISYHLFDKPKDAHFSDNLICVCQSCHALIHSKKISLLGYVSEKRRLNLLELLEKLKQKYTNTEKMLLVDFSEKSISSQVSNIDKGSTTISRESTSQANGDGSGKPLTDKAEGEDIV